MLKSKKIWLVLVILIVLAAVVFFWRNSSTEPGDDYSSVQKQTESLNAQSNSDIVSDIEKDVNATDFSGLDADVEAGLSY